MSKGRIGSTIIAAIIIGGAIGTFICTEKVPTGYVGVQYSINGGVQEDLLTQGWHIVAPNKKVNLYSIRTEQLYMSKDKKEGSKENDSFDVMTKDGQLNVDFEMSYSFDTDDVVDLFNKYGGLSGEELVNSKVRGKIKTLVGEITSQYSVLDVHMEKKGEVNKAITEHLKESLKPFGITVESATLSRTEPSEEVKKAIETRAIMEQERQAELAKKEKAIAEQETKRIEAETKKIENEKLNETLTNEMLQKLWIEKWDGKLPMVSGEGASPILDVRTAPAAE